MKEMENADIKKEELILEEMIDVDKEIDAKNIELIKDTLKASGMKNERTIDLMSKDILKMLKTQYDKDCTMDGIYLQPAITDAIQKKIEQITGKKPALKI